MAGIIVAADGSDVTNTDAIGISSDTVQFKFKDKIISRFVIPQVTAGGGSMVSRGVEVKIPHDCNYSPGFTYLVKGISGKWGRPQRIQELPPDDSGSDEFPYITADEYSDNEHIFISMMVNRWFGNTVPAHSILVATYVYYDKVGE